MAPGCLLHAAFSWENVFNATSTDFTRLLQNFSKLKAVKFYNQKKNHFYLQNLCKRQNLVVVCVCLFCMYVCLFVMMFMWHLKPVTNTKRGPEITGVLRTVVQPGELSSAYTVHCQQGFGLSVKQMWTFQVRTKVSIYSSPKHENMNLLRQQCRPICESILIYTASYTENLHFFTNIKRLSLWWSNFWIASYNDFWTHHYGNILFVNSCNEETLFFFFFACKDLTKYQKKSFSESIPPSRNLELSAQT